MQESANQQGATNRGCVVLDGVSMSYGSRAVFSNLSATFPCGAISVILGGSGCGKSTVLRLIGGLAKAHAGHVLVEDRDITRLRDRQLLDVREGLGMLFQGGALLDSLSVYENLALPLLEKGHHSSEDITTQIRDKLNAVGLHDIEHLLPGELSGGMVKRVALARAIIGNPRILLADEPFSGLDPVSTKLIESLLVKINHEFGITLIIVSHHVPSTLRMADRITLMLPAGELVSGTPSEVLASGDQRVLNFLNEDVESGSDGLNRLSAFEAETQPISLRKASRRDQERHLSRLKRRDK